MKWLEQIIDNCLTEMSKNDIFMKMPGDIPFEMLDNSISQTDDWKGWKPIASIITDQDINRLEDKIGYQLPFSYRYFLKYKHFYSLKIADHSVNLPHHLPNKKLTYLHEYFFESFDPEFLIEKNYIYFADFYDYGLLCFDANEPAENNEYKIVYIDHERLEDIHLYANNFRELLEADSETGNRFIEKLNEYYS